MIELALVDVIELSLSQHQAVVMQRGHIAVCDCEQWRGPVLEHQKHVAEEITKMLKSESFLMTNDAVIFQVNAEQIKKYFAVGHLRADFKIDKEVK